MLSLWALWACQPDVPPEPPASTSPPVTTPPGPTLPPTDGGPADLVVYGDVVTLDAASQRAQGLAVRDGEIVWVGATPVPERWLGDDTEVVDLEGQQVLPGLHDVHNHLLEAFHPIGEGCVVSGYAPLRTHGDTLRACASSQPGDWVVGWGFDLWTSQMPGPTPREVLDAAIPDRPAAILEATSHAVWVNSAALARLGFDGPGPDPVGGVVQRDRDGVAVGVLLDAAGEAAMDAALIDRPGMAEMNEAALKAGLAEAARNGITSVGDGRAYWKRGYVEAWRAVDARGELTVRAVVPLWAYPGDDDDAQIAALTAMFSREPGARLRFDQVKIYSDGLVWITTGALLEPYVGPQLAGPTGLTYFDAGRLARYTTELERVGFDMHIHAIGDRGVRQALDAVAAARATNGDVGARHRLTHVEWVAPDDVPRFAALGVAADVQLAGSWTAPSRLHDNDFLVGPARVDERAYRVRDLYDAGARVVLSSDYDVGPMSPFVGMARAVDRGDQSLPSVEAALRAVTIEAAWVLRQEELVGSLEVGKRADFVVVDRDVFTTEALAETSVVWTVVDGDETWRAPGFLP
jgi:predicted amidohydrolase YtcJ